jgi:hypothetical protein
MCEFCSIPTKGGADRDAFHSDFAGFFSADAIEAAVRQAKEFQDNNNKSSNTNINESSSINNEDESAVEGGEDDDGT